MGTAAASRLTGGSQAVSSAPLRYRKYLEDGKQRQREKQLNMPVHLRTGTNPLDMGQTPTYKTVMAAGLEIPVKMAVNPMWSTDLKKMNDRIGMRLEYQRKLSASVPGQTSPELPHMPPK